MANLVLIFFYLAILLSAMVGIMAIEFTVTNNAAGTNGGTRFEKDIGEQFSLLAMRFSTIVVLYIFQQYSRSERKIVPKESLFIDDVDGVAYTINGQIHFSARYIEGYSGNLRREFVGVLFHEMAHVWQWNGRGQAPGGLIEGIADFVRLQASLEPSDWVKPGQGDRWDHGYDVTARFLDYCNDLRQGFVAELNKKMKSGYSDNYFVELLGRTVDQLWKDYKAKYSNAK